MPGLLYGKPIYLNLAGRIPRIPAYRDFSNAGVTRRLL